MRKQINKTPKRKTVLQKIRKVIAIKSTDTFKIKETKNNKKKCKVCGKKANTTKTFFGDKIYSEFCKHCEEAYEEGKEDAKEEIKQNIFDNLNGGNY